MPDLFLVNARIWTGDETNPWAEALVVRHGRVAFAGGAADVNVAAGTPRLDAGGRLVVPGFIDGHAHMLATGAAMQSVDLKGVGSEEEAARRVTDRVATTPPGAWITGAGWDQHLWPDARFPHRRSLDAGAPEHPVLLNHTSGHCIWVNTAALRQAGVTSETAAPSGGVIDTDADGQPAGILRDAASRLVLDAVPSPSREERRRMLQGAAAHAHALGITSVHAMDVGRGELAAMRALRDNDQLSLRIRPFLSADRLDDWFADGARTGDGDDMLRIAGVKFFADGALGSLTAWMRQPYEGSEDLGLALQAPEAMEGAVRQTMEHGLAPAVHAIGDRANREVLDIFERLRDLAPPLHRRIEHAQLLATDDIRRFGAIGVTASVQPIHATQDMRKVDRAWGERGRHAYAFASLLASGAGLAFGSDTPVETMDPLAGIHAAVTRRNAAGEPADGWYPRERVSLETALAAYTTGCARATQEEDSLGKIAPGCHADFVLLSGDVFRINDPMAMLDVRADATMVGGNVVYRGEDADLDLLPA